MIFNLKNPHEHDGFKSYVLKLFSQQAIVEIKKKSPQRSIPQNSYIHLLLGYFGCEYGCSAEEAKLDFFKRTCNPDIFEQTRINKSGKKIKYLRSSSDLSTTEMTTAIDRFRNWSASIAGIYLPSPNEGEFLIHIQQEIEKSKEFI